jgi:hypothetical protein
MQSSPATASETRAGACARAVASADASHNLNGDGIAVRAAALHEPNSKHATAQRSWPSPAFGYPAVEELLRADRRKDEFLAILSHELRTPLASIQNALSILSKPTGENPLVRDKMHELIDRQADPSARAPGRGSAWGLLWCAPSWGCTAAASRRKVPDWIGGANSSCICLAWAAGGEATGALRAGDR